MGSEMCIRDRLREGSDLVPVRAGLHYPQDCKPPDSSDVSSLGDLRRSERATAGNERLPDGRTCERSEQ